MKSNTRTTVGPDAGIDEIVCSANDLTLSENASEGRGQSLNSTHIYLAILQDQIRDLFQQTDTITIQAQSIESLTDAKPLDFLPIGEVILFDQQTKKLRDIVTDLEKAIAVFTKLTEESVIRQLASLGAQNATIASGRTPILKLLSHFDSDIRKIVREILNKTSDQSLLWRVAEKCYKLAISSSGNLHADKYFDLIEEVPVESPNDPDFKSEEHYENGNQIDLNGEYAAPSRRENEPISDTRSTCKQGWVDFLISALNNSPNGPTLFYPAGGLYGKRLSLDVPRYLFRTYDADSSGENNDNVIASTASCCLPESKPDILSIEKQEARVLLLMHLDKDCFGKGIKRDNLMSWTSSLLFAIQYAIWRSRKSRIRRPLSEIKICAIDTSEFPMGQFVRDLALIQQVDQRPSSFIFRLNYEEYYNGEYLSQGVLNHSGRSRVVSLEGLKNAGLFQLFPEFEDVKGETQWTKRASELRDKWSTEQVTTDRDIQLALQVAHDCFDPLSQLDVASILLSFKNREYSELVAPGESSFKSNQFVVGGRLL